MKTDLFLVRYIDIGSLPMYQYKIVYSLWKIKKKQRYSRLLRGDYCLEIDLDKNINKKKRGGERLSFPSELFEMLFDKTPSTESEEGNAFYNNHYPTCIDMPIYQNLCALFFLQRNL